MARTAKHRLGLIINTTILLLLSALVVIPLIYVVSISFSTDSDIVEFGYRLIPVGITLDAYRQVFPTLSTIMRAYCVAILVTVLGTFMSLSLTTTIAYVASRKDFPYKKFINLFLLLPLLFNGGMVAYFIVNTQLFNLGDTIWR